MAVIDGIAAPSPSIATGAGAVDARPGTFATAPLDDTADLVPDTAATLAQALSRRAEIVMLSQQRLQQDLQAKIDRMKANFNAAQERQAERMREMNALRDMALEQSKKDDEVLKKYIAMI